MQNECNATFAQFENRCIRIPLVFLDIGSRLSYMSPFIALNETSIASILKWIKNLCVKHTVFNNPVAISTKSVLDASKKH